MNTVKLLGMSDDQDTCSRCGKTGLKRVVWLELEDGSIEHYGVDCAAVALTGSKKASSIKTVNTRCKALELARAWFGRFDASTIERGIFDRTGCLSEVRGNTVRFSFGEYAL